MVKYHQAHRGWKWLAAVLPALPGLLFIASCSGGKPAEPVAAYETDEEPLPERYESDELPKAADELFDDFIYYYASNEQLQRRRTVFPLEVERLEGQRDTLTDSTWHMEPLFMEKGGYVRIFDSAEQLALPGDTTVDRVVVEKIFLSHDSVKQYRFLRTDGRWKMTDVSHQLLKDNANVAFLRFYYQFATDSLFRQQSLASEIEFTGPDPDDDFAQMEGFITPDSWEAFAPELPHDTIYNIVYGEQNGRSKEKHFVICGIANGMETELTFQQKRGKWKLTRLTE